MYNYYRKTNSSEETEIMSATIKIIDRKDSKFYSTFSVAAVDDETGKHLSTGGFGVCDSRYCGKYLKTLTAGGVATPVHNRRGGNVRKMFNKMLEMAPEEGWVVAMLHPFSTSYYRMFGYEKISDHRILRFPTSKLDFVPRHCNLVRYDTDEQTADLIAVYEKFAENRNIMFRRFDDSHFTVNGKKHTGDKNTYIYYDAKGEATGYIKYTVSNQFWVNQMINGVLTVDEIAFTTPEALKEIFSFLRMFEGEMDTIEISNCAMSPEVEMTLRHYIHTTYTLVPDVMARVLDVKAILEANKYPKEEGKFTVKVNDFLDFTKGVYEVSYGDGEGIVKKLADTADYDLSADMPAFTQMLYGYDEYNSFNAQFLEGVELKNDANDFFRAFPKRPAGLFEHF